VQVFLLRVDEVLGSWPEGTIRGRVWLSPREAADRVREEELRSMLLRLPDLLTHTGVEQDWTLFNVSKEAPE
jgi:hypothetical protein